MIDPLFWVARSAIDAVVILPPSADALETTPVRQSRRQQKSDVLREAVDHVIASTTDGAKPWSVRDMRAVQHTLQWHRQLVDAYGTDAIETRQVAGVVAFLVRGGYAYDRGEKRSAYHDARMRTCDAVASLLLRGDEPAMALVAHAEQLVLPAVAGLVRRMERPRRRTSASEARTS